MNGPVADLLFAGLAGLAKGLPVDDVLGLVEAGIQSFRQKRNIDVGLSAVIDELRTGSLTGLDDAGRDALRAKVAGQVERVKATGVVL